MSRKLNEKGEEVLDRTPVAVPVGFSRRAPSIQDIIAYHMRDPAFLNSLRSPEHETWEDANDFDCGEDYDPTTPYEADFEMAAVQAEHHGILLDNGLEQQPIKEARSKIKKAFDVFRRHRPKPNPFVEDTPPAAPPVEPK